MSYNCTDGGEGTSGTHQVISAERRKAISEFMKTNHPMKSKHHTPEAMAKIIAANRNRVYTKEQKEAMVERGRRLHNIPISNETRKKLSAFRKNHPETWIGGWNKKEVHQYDLEGKYMATYSSAMEAAKTVGNKKAFGDICGCIKGKTMSACGYIWKDRKVSCIDLSAYKIVKTKAGVRLYKNKTSKK